MQNPVRFFAYLILFLGVYIILHVTVISFIAPDRETTSGLFVGVIANCAASALLHVDHRLKGIEDKLEAIGAVSDFSQTE